MSKIRFLGYTFNSKEERNAFVHQHKEALLRLQKYSIIDNMFIGAFIGIFLGFVVLGGISSNILPLDMDLVAFAFIVPIIGFPFIIDCIKESKKNRIKQYSEDYENHIKKEKERKKRWENKQFKQLKEKINYLNRNSKNEQEKNNELAANMKPFDFYR